jgi:hypothetical protein
VLPEPNSAARLCVSTHCCTGTLHTVAEATQCQGLWPVAGGCVGVGWGWGWAVAVLEGVWLLRECLDCWRWPCVVRCLCLCLGVWLDRSRSRCIRMHDPSDSHIVWEAGRGVPDGPPAVAVCRCRVAPLSQLHACVESLFVVACSECLITHVCKRAGTSQPSWPKYLWVSTYWQSFSRGCRLPTNRAQRLSRGCRCPRYINKEGLSRSVSTRCCTGCSIPSGVCSLAGALTCRPVTGSVFCPASCWHCLTVMQYSQVRCTHAALSLWWCWWRGCDVLGHVVGL